MVCSMHQDTVIEFLKNPRNYDQDVIDVDVIETHISYVFITNNRVYKLKRAVHYPYLDFSSLDKRKYYCDAEISINRRTAPDLYIGVAAVMCDDAGKLHITHDLNYANISQGKQNQIVEYLVVMKRFDEATLFHNLAQSGQLNRELIEQLSITIVEFHRSAKSINCNGSMIIKDIIDNNAISFKKFVEDEKIEKKVSLLQKLTLSRYQQMHKYLNNRSQNGRIRLCHGDLHLRNICMFGGKPTLFDAIEFNEDFSKIDIFYDLAFLIMDLGIHNHQRLANFCMNTYIDRSGDVDGLSVLPLFLSLRAAIRAHVGFAALKNQIKSSVKSIQQQKNDITQYLDHGIEYLKPSAPVLVAVGGLSGSGKSRLAREIAPNIGLSPGARVIRTDVMRKQLMKVDLLQKLDTSGYTSEMTLKTYSACYQQTIFSLKMGYSVVFDAVFAKPEERLFIQQLARNLNIPFIGLWLDAPLEIRKQRVTQRINNVSDAGIDVLNKQMDINVGDIYWSLLDSSGSRQKTLSKGQEIIRSSFTQNSM